MVNTIEHKGKRYPVRLNYRATKSMVLKLGRHEPDPKLHHDFEYWEWMCFFALKEGCRIEGVDFDLTIDDVLDIFDEQFDKSMEVLMSFTQPTKEEKPKGVGKPKATRSQKPSP